MDHLILRMSSYRRLAAIMFADIVGYTAMMQRNEQEGLQKVNRFNKVLSTEVEQHQGEILQFMGDGCLCIFHSAVQAMHAAKAIQESLKEAPQVPLRIGIHIGDIVKKEGAIYGDGVNLASRVESMGVPGSILVTERVIHDVKSHPEFEMASLGKFQFKNVAAPMEVFALANAGFVVPKKGEVLGKFAPAKDNPLQKRSSQAAGIIAILIALGFFIGKYVQSSEDVEKVEKSIAVLPFKNMSNDSEQEYFSDGISEDILTQLARIGDLKVIARTSSFSFKGTGQTIPEIAKILQVEHILEGSVRRHKNKVRISTQLVHAASGTLLWAEEYNRDMKDIFAVQQEVSKEIAQKLKAELSEEESLELNQPSTYDPEAYTLLLKARKLINDFNHEQLGLTKDLLDQAFALDSTNPNILAEIGNYYLQEGTAFGNLSPEIAYEQVILHLDKALALDPKNGNAYGYMGRGKMWMEWDFEGADLAFEKARKYKGDWRLKTLLNMYMGRIESAKKTLTENQQLDPRDPFIGIFQGMIDFFEGNLTESLEEFQHLMALNPYVYDSYKFSARIFQAQGNDNAAIDLLEKGANTVSIRAPYLTSELAIAYHNTGQDEKTQHILQEITENWNTEKTGSPAFFLAIIYANLGEIDTAFEWLEKSYDAHEVEMLWLKMDPLTRPLQDDPRYQNLLDRVGFP